MNFRFRINIPHSLEIENLLLSLKVTHEKIGEFTLAATLVVKSTRLKFVSCVVDRVIVLCDVLYSHQIYQNET